MSDPIRRVPLSDVNLGVDLFSCSYPSASKPLEDSIHRVGVLRPIQLVRRGERLVVASGFRRALAAGKIGLSTLECSVVESSVLPDHELFFLNLEDNLSSRSFNLFEKALAVKRIFKDLSGVDPAKRNSYLQLLGVSPEEMEIARYLSLEGLAPTVKDFLLERALPDRFAMLFLGIPGDEAMELAGLARRLRFTASQIRELLELGTEIAGRDGSSLKEVIRFLEARIDPSLKGSPKGRDAFFHALRERRFPDLTKTKAEVEVYLAPIQGVPGVRVNPPLDLEGDEFSAQINFRNAVELESRARALLAFAQSKDLIRAMDLLENERNENHC